MKVDLHVHTCYSRDSLTPLEAVIEVAHKRGIDKVAITDHDRLAGALALREMAPELTIVGEEITTTAGEIIAYFLEEEIPAGLPPEEAIARVREQGGVVGVPHPLDRLRRQAMGEERLLPILGLVDALEVFNSRTLFPGNNRRAEELARAHGLLQTAGSDAHTIWEIGHAYVEMPPFNDKEEFLQSLARGRIFGRTTIPLIHFISIWVKIRKLIERSV